jgi:hypothetical protein
LELVARGVDNCVLKLELERENKSKKKNSSRKENDSSRSTNWYAPQTQNIFVPQLTVTVELRLTIWRMLLPHIIDRVYRITSTEILLAARHSIFRVSKSIRGEVLDVLLSRRRCLELSLNEEEFVLLERLMGPHWMSTFTDVYFFPRPLLSFYDFQGLQTSEEIMADGVNVGITIVDWISMHFVNADIEVIIPTIVASLEDDVYDVLKADLRIPNTWPRARISLSQKLSWVESFSKYLCCSLEVTRALQEDMIFEVGVVDGLMVHSPSEIQEQNVDSTLQDLDVRYSPGQTYFALERRLGVRAVNIRLSRDFPKIEI